MDIERLKELKDYLRVANELSILNDDNLMQRIVESNDVTNTIDIAIELLNAEIARQSVKSEEVQEAIGDLLDMKEHWCADSTDNDAISIDLAITALQAYQPLSVIKWTGDNLREVISMTGWNESASSKWTWEEYEQVVKEKGLKIFTPDGVVIAAIGSWIVRDGNDCHVLQAYEPTIQS